MSTFIVLLVLASIIVGGVAWRKRQIDKKRAERKAVHDQNYIEQTHRERNIER